MSQGRPSWIGHTLHNRYQINELLGRGGMATVYKGIDLKLQREVAIKLIHTHLAQEADFVTRFKREASTVAKLRHGHIVRLYEFDNDKGVYYMILEYVDGPSLEQRLDKLKENQQLLPLNETIEIMSTLCDAVEYAHQQNLIHRDLKPGNVLFSQNGHLYLSDFGVVRIVGEKHTMTIAGSAYYMSPEQARGAQDLNHRSDIYGLGVMLYEMACGQTPFKGGLGSLIQQHMYEPVPDIRQLNRNVPKVLTQIIEKALAKEPDERFQSAYEMGQALRQLKRPSDVNINPNPPNQKNASGAVKKSTPPRENKPTRRWPFLLGFLLLLIVSMISGIAIFSALFSSAPASPTPVTSQPQSPTAIAQEAATVTEVIVITPEPSSPSTETLPPPTNTPTATVTVANLPTVSPTVAPVSADLRFGVLDRGMNCPFMSDVVAHILQQERGIQVELVAYATTDELFAALASTEKPIDLTLCVADPQDRSFLTQHVGYIQQIGDAIRESPEGRWLVMVNGLVANPLEREYPCVYSLLQKLEFEEAHFEQQNAKSWVENNPELVQEWNRCE